MGKRLTKIHTGTGDDGTTGLGERELDAFNAGLPGLKEFIRPGGATSIASPTCSL